MTRPGKVSKSGWNYRVWTFPSGETQPTSGALLLKGYTLHDNPAAQWICPIRSCRILFTRLEGLGAHFNTVHRASLLNDNDDGTLSIVKKVEADGIIMPAKVVSRKPLDPGESPLKEPSFSKPAMVASYQTPSTSAILGANTLISEDDIGKVGMALWKYVQGHLINTPLSPIPQSNDVRMLLKYMVHIRDVVWNTKIQTKFREADAKYISAIILQVAGQKAQAPCDKCMEGKGPFQGCFVLPPNAPWSLRQLITGCANCHYKNKHSQCSLSISSRKANLELEQSEKLPEGSSHKKKKAIQPRGPSLSGSSHEQNLISNPPNGINMTSTSTANLAQMLGLEAWEIAPGRISDEQSDSVDNFAFSNSYMAQNQAVRIGHGVSFQVITIKPGTVHYWSASANKIRICSVASGKLQISIHGQEFSIGPNGMVRIRPGVECTAVNKLYMDATVHVTTLPGDVCG
ncbi:uncharacterized protein F4812DRAFT_103859 [Daldinia caldariorum]|uniref:uncharacterized protein n=1 Tax=Daldinia caldariorum TaxID=326644 RepID=UPI0020082776|nr:uncharacterized protein F4812DRAFT_103859 [Daldinia caldariorum]KAI1465600.1 hypothetical protein F4812DRAFT_103859 [Daldinia caldariorum]